MINVVTLKTAAEAKTSRIMEVARVRPLLFAGEVFILRVSVNDKSFLNVSVRGWIKINTTDPWLAPRTGSAINILSQVNRIMRQ